MYLTSQKKTTPNSLNVFISLHNSIKVQRITLSSIRLTNIDNQSH